MSSIRIVLVDDHALVRAGFRSLLQNFQGLEIVAEASDGQEAIQMTVKHRPDIVLMDIAMPGLNGLETTARITQDLDTRVIILSMHANAEYTRRAIQAGAKGYLLKDSTRANSNWLSELSRGETYLTPAISKHILDAYTHGTVGETRLVDQLTLRQREILALMAEGYSRKEISQRLNISVKTFDTYRAQLMELLNVQDRAGLLRCAYEMGLLIRGTPPL